MSSAEIIYDNSAIRVAYFAMVLILILLVLYYVCCPRAEKLEGNQIYTAGASMRVIGQQFTSTDQGSNDIVYNEQIMTPKPKVGPVSGPSTSGVRTEHLVNERGFPDFWETNSTLNAYKEEQLPGYIS